MLKRIRSTELFVSALLLPATGVGTVHAQALEAARTNDEVRPVAASASTAPTAGAGSELDLSLLKSEYRVTLTNVSPALPYETAACNNRAQDELTGTLTRVDATEYTGRLTRTTTLGFCGAHASQVEACTLKLTGTGTVAMAARAYDDGGGPELHATWKPVSEDTEVELAGTCSPKFAAALKEMYLSTERHLDLPLDRAKATQSLEEYGWLVELD